MDRKMKIKKRLVRLSAGLLIFCMPLTASADETEPAECTCEVACTLKEQDDTCPICAKEDADLLLFCTGEKEDALPQDDGRESKEKKEEEKEEALAENGAKEKEFKEKTLSLQAAENDKSNGLVFEWLSQVPKEKTTYTAGGGEIIWEPKLSGETVVSGTVTLKNTVINSTGMGINFPVPVNIRVEGENRITSDSIGIYLADRATAHDLDLNITGSGSLIIKSKDNGTQTAGNIVIDTVRLDVLYGSSLNTARGIITIRGDIEIKNSNYVKVRSNPEGVGYGSDAIYAAQNVGPAIRISKSHVIAITGDGSAIHSLADVEFTSSDIRAVGKTSGGASGTVVFGQCTMSGGTLFVQNNGTDEDLEWPPILAKPIKGTANAVIYGAQNKKQQYLEGDCVWYIECSYDEAADKVTVSGKGYIYGDVTWNNNMSFAGGKSLSIGSYSKKDSSLTIPKGAVVNMPSGSTLNVRYNENAGVETTGKLIIHGTLNVQDKSSVYNLFDTSKKIGGCIYNTGSLNVSAGGLLQNRNLLENCGTIGISGDFTTIMLSNYNGSTKNTGKINGFVKEMHNDSYVYEANGKTVLKSGQTLTLGAKAADDGKNNVLRIPKGGGLTIEEGAVVDAKTNVTSDTVSDYINLNDTIIVNGRLLLPEDIPDNILTQIAASVIGNGEVKIGEVVKYIVTVNKGNAIETQLLQDGEKVVLPEKLTREGYRFDGWFIKNGASLEPFDKEMEVHASAEIVSKWTKLVSEKPEEQKKPEQQKQPVKTEVDTAGSIVLLNNKAKVSMSGSKLKVSWGKISGAEGYDIYAAKCGNRLKLVNSVKDSGKSNVTISRAGKKKISKKGSYKVQVNAYRIVNGKKEVIAKSLSLHVVGKDKKGYTNAKSVKVSKTKLTVKKGKSKKIKAQTVKQNKRKKLLPKKHIVPYRYYSTNTKIASVSKNGKIKGKKKGSCTVYVVAANGVKKGVKVTVK